MLKNFEKMKAMLASSPTRRRIGVVAAQDEHTLDAVTHAARDGMVRPVLIGDEPEIRRLLRELEYPESEAEIIHIPDPAEAAQKAADMARAGEIDCIMKGKIETGAMMKVFANRERGIRESEVLSMLAVMESPHYHKLFGISDVGLLTKPTLEQKAALIANAVGALRSLGVKEPKVAVLAAVEKVNPKMPETLDADALKQKGMPGCIIEGPISYDLAMDPDAAAIKGYHSPVAGDADLLVVPDIVCGNIAAKTITCIGGGRTCGAVLGALVPIVVTSRSATADDKYMSIVLSALIGG